jgi:hypothetical protein
MVGAIRHGKNCWCTHFAGTHLGTSIGGAGSPLPQRNVIVFGQAEKKSSMLTFLNISLSHAASPH